MSGDSNNSKGAAAIITKLRKLRILTVGDGDLSLSLAIAECYNSHCSCFVELTASTLLDSLQTLFATYPQTAPAILDQLEQTYKIPVLFGVDACFLHERFSKNHDNHGDYIFDLVIFHHPHLGSSSSSDKTGGGGGGGTADGDNDNVDEELDLIQRHMSLLAHYLASAQQIAKTVHVALCSNQAVSWRLLETANRLGLQLTREIPVQHPFHQIFPTDNYTNDTNIVNDGSVSSFPWQNDPDWKPPPPAVDIAAAVDAAAAAATLKHQQPQHQQNGQRRTISRKQKSRHWLGRYGYQHVRTVYQGQSEAPNLAGSTHYVFQKRKQEEQLGTTSSNNTNNSSIPPAPSNLQSSSSSSAAAAATATAETSLTASSTSTTTATCSVCGIMFPDQTSLEMHIKAPALPCLIACSFEKTEMACDALSSSTTAASNNVTKQFELLSQSNLVHVSTTTKGQNDESPSSSSAGGAAVSVVTVPCDYEGKRLRWFLQHYSVAANSNNDNNNDALSKLSKRQWEGLIKNGGVSVNGVVAMDSGRILSTGWTVAVRTLSSSNGNDKGEKNPPTRVSLPKPVEQNNNRHPIQVVAQEEHGDVAFCIVWKPVGTRTIGSFDSCTLEETFTLQQHQQEQQQNHANINSNSITAKYKSLSKLDTGCSGLCVLQNVNYMNKYNCNKIVSSTNSPCPLKVTHTFTILVHGRVPDEWQTPSGILILLPTDGMRRWTKKQKKNEPNSNGSEPSLSPSSCAREGGCQATLCCLEQATLTMIMCRNNKNHDKKNADTTSSSVPPSSELLSTVAITTDSQSSGLAQTIAYFLRKTAGYPVVGDRFAVSEYLSLPRSIRNRIKQRLCMGCTSVRITIPAGDNSSDTSGQQQYTKSFDCKVPEKWSASFWREFCAETHITHLPKTHVRQM